jgi:hypothetical protein
MVESPRRAQIMRRVLIAALVIAVLVLAAAAAVVIPILTHSSAGGSGQESLPEGFVNATSATGADGRTRELVVETLGGNPADLAALVPGEELVVRGTGFDAGIGIYVAICAVPSIPGEKPSPCLGGIPETAEGAIVAETSVWITNDFAWAAFANQGYADAEAGTFAATLLVPEPSSNGLDCTASLCAITTRADHTAANDRVQDLQLPVAFAG